MVAEVLVPCWWWLCSKQGSSPTPKHTTLPPPWALQEERALAQLAAAMQAEAEAAGEVDAGTAGHEGRRAAATVEAAT